MNFGLCVCHAYHSDLYLCLIKMLIEIILFKLANNLFVEKFQFQWGRIYIYIFFFPINSYPLYCL